MKTQEQQGMVTVPSTDCPEPTITSPSATMDYQDDDQSLGRAPPLSPTDNGSVSVSVHQEDDQPVNHQERQWSLPVHPLSLGPPSPSCSTPLSLGLPSPSQSAGERVSLLMDIDVAEAEVTPVRENRDQPGSESDDLNSVKPVLIRRDHRVSQVTPLSQVPPATSRSASRSYVRSKSVPSHFKVPSFPGTVQKKKERQF
ncbi:unnamed protein product [Gadus morhua 'NCC']